MKENPEQVPAPIAPVVVAAPVEAPKSTVRSMSGTVSLKKVWTFEIEDENAIPKRFWSVDESKIKKAMSEGARELPGIKIFQKTQVSSRS